MSSKFCATVSNRMMFENPNAEKKSKIAQGLKIKKKSKLKDKN